MNPRKEKYLKKKSEKMSEKKIKENVVCVCVFVPLVLSLVSSTFL
jgi:hypothetical protein